MSEEKIYCGNGKVITTKFGPMTKISMHKDDINKIVGYMKANGLEWINMNFKEKREPKEGKPTHYLEVDTWKPTQQAEPVQQQAADDTAKPPVKEDGTTDDLPFVVTILLAIGTGLSLLPF